jgi:sialic acid synthase SpsE
MKQDEGALDPIAKRRESEFFHGKALDVAAGFLPSECPLVNHILMSYQKHHAPSQQVIQEGEEYEEDLKIIRPLQGIESNKHQPIVRANRDAKYSIPTIKETHVDYIKFCHNHNQKILNLLKPKDPIKIKTSSKKIQTISVQSSSHYPSISGNKHFSLKTTKKSPLILNPEPDNK